MAPRSPCLPVAPTNTLAELRLPPQLAVKKTARDISRRARPLKCAPTESDFVLKLIILADQEVVSVKLRKDKLSSTEDLVEVINFRLMGTKTAHVAMKIAIKFPDRNLKPIVLRDGRRNGIAPDLECFVMDYLTSRPTIYVSACLVK